MQKIQQALRQLTLQRDGVDGTKIYLYGEGFNFGEVANNRFFPNASQINLYGNGIGRSMTAFAMGSAEQSLWRLARTGLRHWLGSPIQIRTSPSGRAHAKGQVAAGAGLDRIGLTGNLRDFRSWTAMATRDRVRTSFMRPANRLHGHPD